MGSVVSKFKELLDRLEEGCILVLGNEFRGDDAAALEIGNHLKSIHPLTDRILMAYNVPMNFVGKIIRLKPDFVLILDAVDLNRKPGSIIYLEFDHIVDYKPHSTHSQNLTEVFDLVQSQLAYSPQVYLVGIQIVTTKLYDTMSTQVEDTISRLLDKLD